MLFAVLVPNTDPFAFDDDAGLARLKTLVLDQMVPDVRAICIDDFAVVIVLKCPVHERHLCNVRERLRQPIQRRRIRCGLTPKVAAKGAAGIGPDDFFKYGQMRRYSARLVSSTIASIAT